MRHQIDIIAAAPDIDDEGFAKTSDKVLASVRAAKEERHGSEQSANMATFATAVVRFRFRRIPGVDVTTAHAILCDGNRYRITSVLNVRGLAVEIMAEKMEGTVL